MSGLAASVGLPVAALAGSLVSGPTAYLLRSPDDSSTRCPWSYSAWRPQEPAIVSWLLTLGDIMVVGPTLAWLSGSLHAQPGRS